MPDSLRFETPENVQIHYEPAGLGTRFLAWFIDQILVTVVMVGLIVALFAVGASFQAVFDSLEDGPSADKDRAVYYAVGLIFLLWGLGSFLYFGCLELFMRGQTVGKRLSNIRVVSADGFQLDASSIIVRNMFRVVDHMPPMWVFPFVSPRGQRSGDMVAGTLVVFDAPTRLSPVREMLADRTAAEAQFRFDTSLLKRLTAKDFAAVERVLERRPELPTEQLARLLNTYTKQIANKLQIDQPSPNEQLRFLEDLFAAELRRQDRKLA